LLTDPEAPCCVRLVKPSILSHGAVYYKFALKGRGGRAGAVKLVELNACGFILTGKLIRQVNRLGESTSLAPVVCPYEHRQNCPDKV